MLEDPPLPPTPPPPTILQNPFLTMLTLNASNVKEEFSNSLHALQIQQKNVESSATVRLIISIHKSHTTGVSTLSQVEFPFLGLLLF